MMWITTLLILLPALWMAWVVWSAPEGYEDEDGFHYGRKDKA